MADGGQAATYPVVAKSTRAALGSAGFQPARHTQGVERKVLYEAAKDGGAPSTRSRRVTFDFVPAPATAAKANRCAMAFGSLRWSDLDEAANTVRIRASAEKSKRGRVVPISAKLMADLVALRAIHREATGAAPHSTAHVFLSPLGLPWAKGGSSNARVLLNRILRRAEIKRRDEDGRTVDLHALRTTFGSRLARLGVAPQVLQYLMGHSDIRITMKHYVHLRLDDAREALKAVPALPSVAVNGEQERAASSAFPA